MSVLVSTALGAHLAFSLYWHFYLRQPWQGLLPLYGRALRHPDFWVLMLVVVGVVIAIPFLALILLAKDALLPVMLAAAGWGLLVLVLLSLVDAALPRVSGVEIVLLAVALHFAAPANPVAPWLLLPLPPMSVQSPVLGWLLFTLSWWPLLLVWALMRRNTEPDPRLSLLLAVWVNLAYAVLLAPAVWQVMKGFDSTAPREYGVALFNSVLLIHWLLRVLPLLLTKGFRVQTEDGPVSPAVWLSQRIELGQLPTAVLLGVSAGYFAALWGLRMLLPDPVEFITMALGLLIAAAGWLQGRVFEGERALISPERDMGQVVEELWSHRRFLLVLPLVLVCFVLGDNSGAQGHALDRSNLAAAAIIGFVAKAAALLALLWLLTLVFDAVRLAGRRWTGAARAQLMLTGVVALALWCYERYPPADAFAPPAERSDVLPADWIAVDASASGRGYTLPAGLVYLGPAQASRWRAPRGKVLYFEGGGRRQGLCSDHSISFTHYRFPKADEVECRFSTPQGERTQGHRFMRFGPNEPLLPYDLPLPSAP